jgi:hypothetical protein
MFAKASTVFIARVVRVEEAGLVSLHELQAYPPWRRAEELPNRTIESVPPWPAIEASLRIVEVLKGQPPADGKVRAPRYVLCGGTMILAGLDHVFFLFEGNFVHAWTAGRVPTRGQADAYVDRLRELSKREQR